MADYLFQRGDDIAVLIRIFPKIIIVLSKVDQFIQFQPGIIGSDNGQLRDYLR